MSRRDKRPPCPSADGYWWHRRHGQVCAACTAAHDQQQAARRERIRGAGRRVLRRRGA